MSVAKLYHRHYKILQSTCIDCIIKGKTNFLFKVHKDFEWPKGFPKGTGVYDKNKTEWQNRNAKVKTRRLNAKAVLQWMYENGRSKVSVDDICKCIEEVNGLANGSFNGMITGLFLGYNKRGVL